MVFSIGKFHDPVAGVVFVKAMLVEGRSVFHWCCCVGNLEGFIFQDTKFYIKPIQQKTFIVDLFFIVQIVFEYVHGSK